MTTTITSTELDFNAIKNNLKASLANSTEFADYNFEGSGLSNLLDVLATNTHMNALVANMALNESYLTTAQLRSSVVSLAEGIGYIPSSKVAAQATVNLSINTGALAGRPQIVTLPRGTKFNSTVNDVNYTFETIATVTAEDDGFGLYQFKTVDGDTNIVIKEGVSTTKTFFVTENSIDSVYVIPDPDIDITTAVVEVFDDATSSFFETYINLKDADTIDDTTKLYILREAPNGFFELSFGDGNTLGKAPSAGNKIVINYLSTSGPDANTADNFSPVNQVTVLSNNYTLSVTTNTKAQAGSLLETVPEVKFGNMKFALPFATRPEDGEAGGGSKITLIGDCEFEAFTLTVGDDTLDLNGNRAEFNGSVTYNGTWDADGLAVFHSNFTKYGTLNNAASGDIMTMSTSGHPTFSYITGYRTFFTNGGVQLGTGGFTNVPIQIMKSSAEKHLMV